jgi:hypothetical protein
MKQKILKMNKPNIKLVITLVLIAILFVIESSAQGFKGLDKAPHDISYYRTSMISVPMVKVIYGRPQKNGKEVFGNTVAYDEIWRTGANEATEVKFYQDIVFGDVQVEAGTYVLYTIPGEREWEIILSSNLDVLGAFQYDPLFDVARIKVTSKKAEVLENFSINFKEKNENVQMVLGWDTTRVYIPITLSKNEDYAKL